ncbi:MAG: methyltransferase domain-containing protein [Candidatus Hodarchaeales archaeon]|jgi:ubiquinone/menaquinone biosynthesis C-methylase UbiE
MVTREEKIKLEYVKRLKKAKTNLSDSNSGSEVDQAISFGCLLLDGFIADFVKLGMTVVDFGSGPGHDLFLAARAVGSEGKAIGVDMTEEMNTEVENKARERGLVNVETITANIEDIPLPDDIVDVIISNCVICIASNKLNVFKEAFRLLKPGGIFLDADLIANKPSTTGTHALTLEQHKQALRNVGFEKVLVERGSKHLVTHEQEGVYSGLISARKPTD